MERSAIALINVPYGTSGESMRPLGLSFLGAYLRDCGWPAEGFDFSDSTNSPEELVSRYELQRFNFIGLSFYNINAESAYRMARSIKLRNPSSVIIAGGPHPSARYKTMFTAHPEIDFVVRGEGEETLLELLQTLCDDSVLDAVPSVAFQRDGQLIVGPDRPRVRFLDDLPPPIFHFEREQPAKPLFFFDCDSKRLRPAVALVSSRSCPFKCNFCAIILIGRDWRSASPQKIIQDIRALENAAAERYEHVYFLEANFFVRVSRALEIARALQEFRPGITFSFSTRVSQLLKGREVLSNLRELGLRAVELGVESGSAACLKRFAKDTAPEQNEEAVDLLNRNRIQLFLDFIMFDAEASIEDLSLNLRFLERTGLDSYVPWDHIFSYMTPYLGTRIREHYERDLGFKFKDDILPDPASLLLDAKVRAVYEQLQHLRPLIPDLKKSLQTLEDKINGVWNTRSARWTLNAMTLRRLPYIVLRNLVLQAYRTSYPLFEAAIPRFSSDNGDDIPLSQFLEYALH